MEEFDQKIFLSEIKISISLFKNTKLDEFITEVSGKFREQHVSNDGKQVFEDQLNSGVHGVVGNN